MEKCVLFVDLRRKREIFNGNKRVHDIKFQPTVCPNGTVANLFGPNEGYRHNSFMLTRSKILHQLEHNFVGSDGDKLCIYGDPPYQL